MFLFSFAILLFFGFVKKCQHTTKSLGRNLKTKEKPIGARAPEPRVILKPEKMTQVRVYWGHASLPLPVTCVGLIHDVMKCHGSCNAMF